MDDNLTSVINTALGGVVSIFGNPRNVNPVYQPPIMIPPTQSGGISGGFNSGSLGISPTLLIVGAIALVLILKK